MRPGSDRGKEDANETRLAMSSSLLEMKNRHIGVDCTMFAISHNKTFLK